MSESKQKKYWAFISYSSKDAKWGKWLHKRLENYSIPTEFQQIEFVDGTKLGKHVRPVFRDRDELSSSAELGPAILEALENSRFLIVLCSPNSAKSEWVNKEIEDFRAIHGDDKVLALILDGEPNASTNRGLDNDLECFPPALRAPLEPLAGDLRAEADGKERGFLKIIAGIADIGFDDLYRRHERAQKKRRLLAGIFAAGIIAALSGLSFFAFTQKSIAEAQSVIAKEQTKNAKGEAKRANEQTELARRQKERADEEARLAQMSEADSKILLAVARLESNRIGESRGLLHQIPTWYRGLAWNYLNRQLLQSDFVCVGHTARVETISFSSSENLIASLSAAKTVKIWDASTGTEVSELSSKVRRPGTTDIVFSPSGRRLAISHENSISVFDSRTGKLLQTLSGHEEDILSLKFEPRGKMLASATKEKFKVWNLETGDEINSFAAPKESEWWRPEIIFNHKSHLACVSRDALKIWNAKTGAEIGTLGSSKEAIHGAKFGPDGRVVATYGDDGSIKIWDVETLQLINVFSGHEGVKTLEYSADGRRIVSLDRDGVLKVCDASSGAQLKSYSTAASCVIYSPDTRRLITGDLDGKLKIWEAEKSRGAPTVHGDDVQIGSRIYRRAGLYESVSFNADSSRIATAGSRFTILDAATRKMVLSGDSFSNKAVFCPDNQKLAIISEKTTRVLVFDDPFAHTHAPGPYRTPTEIARRQPLRRPPKYQDKQVGIVKLIELNSQKNTQEFTGHVDVIEDLSFSPDGGLMASASSDKTVRIWDTKTRREIHTLVGHVGTVNCVDFSPDGLLIASGSDDHRIKIWDVKTGQEQKTFESVGRVNDIAFSPNGNLVAAAENTGLVRIWDANAGVEVMTLTGHRLNVNCVQFHLNGTELVSGGDDNKVIIWSLTTGQEMLSLQLGSVFPVKSVAISPDGNRLAAIDLKSLYIWEANQRQELTMLGKHKTSVGTAGFDSTRQQVYSSSNDRVSFSGLATPTHIYWDPVSKTKVSQSIGGASASSVSEASPDGKWFVETDGKAVLLYDLEFRNSPSEVGYRKAKSKFAPRWHQEQAAECIKKKQLFAAVFHQAWLLKHDLENETLANDFKNAYSKLQAQFKEEGRDLAATLPHVVKEAIKLLPNPQTD